MKLFYIELKYKNKIDIIGEFLVKSEDEVAAIKDVMQNIKEINPSVVNSVLPNFDISLEDLSDFYSYEQLKSDIDKLVIDSGALPDDSKNLTILGSSTDTSNFLSAFKLLGNNSESVISSTQSLGSIDMTVPLEEANFANPFEGLASGLGNFFIGEGEGAVRIDYDTTKDSLADVIDRVNNSDGNVHMFYDPIGDRFVVRNKEMGAIGIVMHENDDWDSISSANSGNGNLLALMGLAPPPLINE